MKYECKNCGAIFKVYEYVCPACGYEKPLVLAGKSLLLRKMISFIPGPLLVKGRLRIFLAVVFGIFLVWGCFACFSMCFHKEDSAKTTLETPSNEVPKEETQTDGEPFVLEVSNVQPYRIWRDLHGRKREARFVEASEEYVVLEKKNGKRTSVQIKNLAKKDAQLVRQLRLSLQTSQ